MNVQNIKGRVDTLFNKYVMHVIPDWMTANHVTGFRLVCVPLVPLVYVLVSPWFAAILFFIAAGSDYLDGLLARTRGMTQWGKLWDERADKLLILVTLVFIMGVTYGQAGTVFEVFLIGGLLVLVFVRDGVMTAARHKGMALTTVLWSAKVKTLLQMMSCVALILGAYTQVLFQVGLLLLVVSTILSLYSAWIYVLPLRQRLSRFVGWE